MRRNPEAVAVYRAMLRERGVDEDKMSDELVIETIQRTADRLLEFGRKMYSAMESVRSAAMRATEAMGRLYEPLVTVAGHELVRETELDLSLRAQGLDVRLLELFDEPSDG